ncbi:MULTISPECIES: nuclear transport factor 2 family protein [unclassified Streptomyces]|uniref:nuclear transport factor 2 family protein n=1 Tax=unclassified Streptomyces TaxID=2593676 RepID=UPI000F5BCDC1|nr:MULTISPECIES: nuclear transport factor 2 family protein [unclassified Streptomyces]WSG54271.1 nuclear transport factor 2 family protein [Streptomyces sp. NBC_01732]WSX04901.1 nuclear transport factor 2 family protein [Streptomyces sp. NBC_00987]MCX5104923.1 nuclear transport factor 2 family protein [Streptomyces sp. NBC_00439]MCX5164027.1 nuclear transport factor 2 family protein [Streptomyces sp. NBC_00305]MCX5222551.1 nuclear transport factor 2 family protein [Streptomyces sp. NBC_00264]
MTAYDEAVQRYFAAWNAATDEELAKAVAAAFTEGATYTDPLAGVRGHEELAATIDGAHQQFPGFEFRLAGTPDGHHDIVRFGWELVSTADGSAPVAGFDVIALADDGRITSVSGFLDRVPGA